MVKAEGKAHTAKAISAPKGATKKPMPEDNRAWAVVGRWSGWRRQGSSGRVCDRYFLPTTPETPCRYVSTMSFRSVFLRKLLAAQYSFNSLRVLVLILNAINFCVIIVKYIFVLILIGSEPGATITGAPLGRCYLFSSYISCFSHL